MRSSDKQKSIFDDIHTLKTIPNTKRGQKTSSTMQWGKGSGDSFSQQQMGDTILTKMIMGHIEEVNEDYKQIKQNIGSNLYYKKMGMKSSRGSRQINGLKRQKMSQPVSPTKLTEEDIMAKL